MGNTLIIRHPQIGVYLIPNFNFSYHKLSVFWMKKRKHKIHNGSSDHIWTSEILFEYRSQNINLKNTKKWFPWKSPLIGFLYLAEWNITHDPRHMKFIWSGSKKFQFRLISVFVKNPRVSIPCYNQFNFENLKPAEKLDSQPSSPRQTYLWGNQHHFGFGFCLFKASSLAVIDSRRLHFTKQSSHCYFIFLEYISRYVRWTTKTWSILTVEEVTIKTHTR